MIRDIRQSDIAGARIEKIHQTYEIKDGLDVVEIYFTTDRGLTFTIPFAGSAWISTEVPANAKQMDDEVVSDGYSVKRGWFGRIKLTPIPSTTDDTVKQIKQRLIVGVYCNPSDKNYGDQCIMVLDDGSQIAVGYVAPHGSCGAGLWHNTSKERCTPRELLVDYFSVPLSD